MGKLIAVAGKGGTGKTTVAALVIKYLLEKQQTPIFAVDADPNYTLGEALGIPVEHTVGMMREEFIGIRDAIPAGLTKESLLERQMHTVIHESGGLDLLVMGRQEGPGCYCYLNNVLRKFLEMLVADYRYLVVDNEAGMEHLSRRNNRKIDLLLIVSNHSVKAARAAVRIADLAQELKLQVGQAFVVLNQAPKVVSVEVTSELKRSGLTTLATLPLDPRIEKADAQGVPLLALEGELEAMKALALALNDQLVLL